MVLWLELQRLGGLIAPRSAAADTEDLILSFGEIVKRGTKEVPRRLDLRSMHGISASKSHIVPLSALSHTSGVEKIMVTRDVQDLIGEVLHGFSDYVARGDEPVRVDEQEWDGRLYVVNNGGGHRFAAIWRWHREHDKPLVWDCAVTTHTLDPDTIQAVTRNHYWLADFDDCLSVHELLAMVGVRSLFADRQRAQDSVPIRGLRSDFTPFHHPCFCLAYPRDHPFQPVLSDWLGRYASVEPVGGRVGPEAYPSFTRPRAMPWR